MKTNGIEASAAIVMALPTSVSVIERSATANSFQNVTAFCVQTKVKSQISPSSSTRRRWLVRHTCKSGRSDGALPPAASRSSRCLSFAVMPTT